jgi:hypothetical protein
MPVPFSTAHQDPTSFEVRGALGHARMEKVLEFLATCPPGSVPTIDLGEISWVHPSALVAFRAGLDTFEQTGRSVTIACPTNLNVLSYMAALGFLQMVPACVRLTGTQGIERNRASGSDRLVPLTRLSSTDDMEQVIETVSRLDGMLGAGDGEWIKTKGAVLSTITEICSNIFHHANVGHGWVAAQTYFNRFTAGDYIELAIGDAGRGIKATLAEALQELAPLPDEVVLARMLNEHLSSRTASGGGMGYYVLQQAARQLDGQFWLRSGLGGISHPRRGAWQAEPLSFCWQGTFVHVRLTCRP